MSTGTATPPQSRAYGGWFSGLPLQLKMVAAFGSVLLLLLLSCVAFIVAQGDQDEARRWTNHTYEVILSVDGVERAARTQQSSLRGYLLSVDPSYLEIFERGAIDFDREFAAVQRLTADNPEQQAKLPHIHDLMHDWRTLQAAPMLALMADPATRAAAVERFTTGTSRAVMDEITVLVTQLGATERGLLVARETELRGAVQLARALIAAVFVFGLALVALAVRLTSRGITQPIVEMTRLMTRLAAHDHAIEVPRQDSGDEIGAIARALQAFKLMAIETYDQNWIEGNVGEISERLQRAEGVEAFADTLTGAIAPLLGCGLAAFYRNGENSERLEFAGGFGIGGGRIVPVGYGEGLVGQCASSREAIHLDQVPESYTRIHSSLGGAPPRSLLLLPMLAQQRLLGVLELGAFGGFSERHRRFLAELLPIAALSFDNLLRARKTQALLEETQAQSEELLSASETLRTQQEELRATNDALQAKTLLLQQQSAQLRASEEELKLQAEELKVANEELTEKSATLQEQKLILEGLQRETQEKADALALASQYKSDFLANMSHELRTPLNSLLILSRHLADNETGHLDAEEIESAQVIHDGGTKLLHLINDILDLSKVEAGKMELVLDDLPLAGFASLLQRHFKPVAREKNLTFDVTIEAAGTLPAVIHTDSVKLEQIANNLLGNAFKFTREGGVRVTIGRPAPGLKLPAGLVPKTTVAIAVGDSGIGIDAEKFPRLFQAFEQVDAGTSRHYGGTGLGLSIARGMAQLLGGDITLASAPGAGSTFTLLLPEQGPPGAPPPAVALASSPAVPAPPASARVSAMAATGPAAGIDDDRAVIQTGDTVILVIEDDLAFVRILIDLIRRKGYRVLAAADGESGLALARHYRPTGVLLDVMLPGMDGWAVLDRFKAEPLLTAIPVHFISGTEEQARGLEAGAVGFLTKPVSKDALLQAFERLLQRAPAAPSRVLIVDDDAGSRQAMRRLLADAGVQLVDTATAEQALLLIEESHFDCIVLDLGLPGISGFEFLERASQRGPLPPVVIHSGRELSREESLRLRQYTDSIVIKGQRSPERLLDEVSLFLHSIRPAPVAAPREVDASLNGRTVLVVDDDMRNIFALSKTLRGKGLKVLMAQDGLKALKQLDDNAGIDIVLMDVMMPGMDGIETTREIRCRPAYRELPVIALTAKAMRGDREKCLEAGANDYLAKPIDIDKLLSMMRVWLRPKG